MFANTKSFLECSTETIHGSSSKSTGISAASSEHDANHNRQRWRWNPFTLQFISPDVESEFIKADGLGKSYSCLQEVAFFAAGVLALVGLFLPVMLSGLLGCIMWWGMFISYSAGLFFRLFRPNMYRERRDHIVIAARISGFGMSLLAGEPTHQAPSLQSAVVCLLLNSPVCFTLASAYVCPLRVQHLLPVVCTSLIFLFTIPKARVCSSHDSQKTAFMGLVLLRRGFDKVLELSLFGGVELSDDVQFACSGVRNFSILAFGIILPAGYRYCREVIRRTSFLRNKLGHEHHQEIRTLRTYCLEGIIWLLIFSMQAAWIVMRFDY